MGGQHTQVAEITIFFRTATRLDIAAMAACRVSDPDVHPADPRMAAYFDGQHHPQRALMPRIGYIALAEGIVIGYAAGHLTTRHSCSGEVQYLFVAPAYRRRGIATALLRLLAGWFLSHAAHRVCVCVDAGSPAAKPFYESLGAVQLSPARRYWYVWEEIEVLLAVGRK